MTERWVGKVKYNSDYLRISLHPKHRLYSRHIGHISIKMTEPNKIYIAIIGTLNSVVH